MFYVVRYAECMPKDLLAFKAGRLKKARKVHLLSIYCVPSTRNITVNKTIYFCLHEVLQNSGDTSK